jgi:hypothetical protein
MCLMPQPLLMYIAFTYATRDMTYCVPPAATTFEGSIHPCYPIVTRSFAFPLRLLLRDCSRQISLIDCFQSF